MDSFEFNKMAGALLGTLLVCMGIGILADPIFFRDVVKPGFDLPVPKASASEGSSAPAPVVPLPVLLAKADATKGENDAHVCETCHNFEKGAGPKIGPPLYGVVNRPIASVPGFDYSDALQKKKGEHWTFDNLFAWINDPQAFAAGTKMAFAGEPDPQKRADILAYLRTLADTPAPLPPVPKAAAAAPVAPAATKASSGGTSPTPAAPAAPPSNSVK